MNKQQERRNRGKDFEQIVRRSWSLVPNIWRMRIADGGGATRPADEIVITPTENFLIEMKRTNTDRFSLDFLREGQIKGLINFDNATDRNYGIVLISFSTENIDEVFAFRLITALDYLISKKSKSIAISEFQSNRFPSLKIPKITFNHMLYYDLKGMLND